MYFQYGTYRHPDNEAKLMAYIVRPRSGPRGKRVFQTYEMHIQIEIVLPTGTIFTTTTAQQYLDGRIQEIITAYQDDYQDAKFYHDNGTPTRHILDNATSISGVRVKHRTWPRGDTAEYATTRTGYVVLEADYLYTYSNLWSYSETVRNIGNGGSRWRLQDLVVGNPVQANLNQITHQRIIQSGEAIGIQDLSLS